MTRKVIRTDQAPKAVGPYSQATLIEGTLYCSGQVAIDPKDNSFIGGSVGQQTKQVLTNLKAVLTEAGMSLSDILKTTIYLQDISDFGEVNEIYATFFQEPYPARVTIQAGALPLNALVEIDAIARKDR